MGDVLINAGEVIVNVGLTLTLWLSLPIAFALGARGYLKKRSDKK